MPPSQVAGAHRPRAFISYARADGEAFASALRKRLQRECPEVTLWQDRAELEGGVGWWKQISEALDQVEVFIMVMTPAVIESAVARKEWRYARQQGVRVCPVLGSNTGEFEFDRLPSWMRKAHCYQLDVEWETFVGFLRSAPRDNRVPFMAPDLRHDFVDRRLEYHKLVSMLVNRTDLNPIAATTALQGAGGFGKTTLAAAVCHDDDVIGAFDDGILWVTLGERPAIQQELTKLYAAVTGDRPAFVDTDDASIELAARLEDRNCLIVLDDVWDPNDVKLFLRGGQQCARLITTRRLQVVTGANASQLVVDEMTEDESVAMLRARLSERSDDVAPFRRLARRLGEWPLLLRLASSQLRERMERGDTLDGALAFVNRALDRRGAVAFDRTNASIRNDAVAMTVGASLALLNPADRTRATELSIFSEAEAAPLSAAAALWGLDDFDTEDLVQRLDDASLLEFDLKTGQIRMHDVLRSHLRAQLSDESALHARLVTVGWPDHHALPDPFAWRWVGWHLVRAGKGDRLRELLLDFPWLTAKLRATGMQAVIRDFDSVGSVEPHLTIANALRLAAFSIDRDPEQLAVQLNGRLDRGSSKAIDQLLESAVSRDAAPHFRFVYPSLTHPGGPLVRIVKAHTRSIQAIVASPDETCALTASADWTLRLWDLQSWRMLRSFEGHSGTVHAAAFAAAGQRIVSVSEDRTVRTWDVATAQCTSVLHGHYEAVRGIAVAPDGNVAASLAEDGVVRLWDLREGRSRPVFKGGLHQLRGIAFMPDGAHVLFGAGDGTMRMLALATGSEARVFEGHTAIVTAVTIARDGATALTASDDGTVRSWDVASGRSVATFRGHEEGVSCVALGPGGRWALSGSSDKTLRVWDVRTGQQTDIMEGHAGTIRSLAVLQEGGQVVTGSTDRTVCCWRLDGPRSTVPFQRQTGAVSIVGISPDGRRAVSGSNRGAVAIWNAGERAFQTLDEHRTDIHVARIDGDGRIALTASRRNVLRVWDLGSGRMVHLLAGHSDGVTGAAMTPSGSHAISTSSDRSIRLWDLHRGVATRVLIGSDTSRRLDHLRDRGLMVSEPEGALEVDSTMLPIGRAALLAISTDGTRAVFANGSTVAIWHTDTGAVVGATLADFDTVELAIDAEARLAVVGSVLSTLGVVDLEAGVVRHTLKARRSGIRSSRILDIVIDSSAVRAVTASRDGMFHFWDLTTGTELAAFDGGVEQADAVAIAPNMTVAFTVAGDTVIATDLATSRQLRRLSLDHNITALAVSPDGENVVVGDESGRVHFLQLEMSKSDAPMSDSVT